ncbi:MAG TPA: 16S rRNA (cytosine(1402)-N(4))-methyltransferase RsmH [Syntrophomonas sp.]|nr:16S rRNA (cytosine(1402)-N(4))-methyltransferase RsmH [Syntrophomonas sp.]
MHQAVLLEETVDLLINDLYGIYVDCTLGGGGHLRRLAGKLESDACLIGIDKDQNILERTRQTLELPNIRLVHGDFRNLNEILDSINIDKVNGIMLDLGVSSFQLDEPERGFSFHEDAVLDMRMDRNQSLTARQIVNEYDENELAGILFRYGEEKYARSISRAIVNRRRQAAIETTAELTEIIRAAVPASYRREKHPARKTFQALRIEVNGELDALEEVLPQAVERLLPEGRLCVITFHSLEDRIVKRFMQEKARECICPPGLPVCVCDHHAELEILTRRPIIASEEECEANSRARSAKLRAARKL